MFVAKANISRINIYSYYDPITLHSPLPLLGYTAQIIRSVRPPLLELLHEDSLMICRVASCSGVIKDCKNRIRFIIITAIFGKRLKEYQGRIL